MILIGQDYKGRHFNANMIGQVYKGWVIYATPMIPRKERLDENQPEHCNIPLDIPEHSQTPRTFQKLAVPPFGLGNAAVFFILRHFLEGSRLGGVYYSLSG